MTSTTTPYTIEFYEDENGDSPVWRWIHEELTPTQRRALTAALEEVLAVRGLDVCKDEFGKALGSGLVEFRVRRSAEDILSRVGKRSASDASSRSGASEKILLRLFFHAHGQRCILLLGGYDKHKRPSKPHQEAEIQTARQRLKAWKVLQQKQRKRAVH